MNIQLDTINPRYNTVFMSRLSFKAFCIEKYADQKSIMSNEVFTLFENNGILQMLDNDYDLLHGHGFDYIIHDIDSIISNGGL